MIGLDAIANVINSAINKIWADATEVERAKAERLAQELSQEFQLLVAQIEVNKVEAQSPGLFKGGWRPFVGWVCGISLAYVALFEPLMRFVAITVFDYAGTFPVIDTDITLQVLLGMLGLAGYRSFEKQKGVAGG